MSSVTSSTPAHHAGGAASPPSPCPERQQEGLSRFARNVYPATWCVAADPAAAPRSRLGCLGAGGSKSCASLCLKRSSSSGFPDGRTSGRTRATPMEGGRGVDTDQGKGLVALLHLFFRILERRLCSGCPLASCRHCGMAGTPPRLRRHPGELVRSWRGPISARRPSAR